MPTNKRAIAFYMKALERAPDNLTALNNLGNTLKSDGQFTEATSVLTKAHAVAPDNHVVLFNLGGVYSALDLVEQAEQTLKRAISIAPSFAEAHYNLGLVQSAQGKRHDAVKSFETTLRLNPAHDPARMEKLHQLAHMCDWSGLAEFEQLPADFGVSDAGVSPFPFLAFEDNPRRQRARSERYARRFGTPHSVTHKSNARHSNKPLKIGYFSADFHNHATIYLMGGLFEHHDKDQFEVIAYSFGPSADDTERQRLLEHTELFREVGHLSPTEITDRARQDELDIAVDLKGYTGDSRPEIFIHRPAPLQISWLGYPGSMGSGAYDYAIADPVVLPPRHRQGFCENIIYLPDSYQVNDNQRQVSTREFSKQECGLPQSGFVFCCFNNSYKITPFEFDVWMRLLKAVDDSVLWLLDANEYAKENLKAAAQTRGVCPTRLVFAERMEVRDHLARQKLADLFIDTFVCNAHTTASDALWSGVPIVTKVGDQFAARVCASLLHAAGLPDLITHTTEAYEALALRLAQNPGELATLRQRLKDTRDTCALFDTRTFAKNIEAAFLHAQRRHEKGGLPQDFHVLPTP